MNIALEHRRQCASEAYADEPEPRTFAAVEAAIETATRVRITPEVLATVPRGSVYLDDDMRANLLRAAFEAAGFDVS